MNELSMFAGLNASNDICQNCHIRQATVNWLGEGSTLDFVHGMFQRWCNICSLEAQLEYARKSAARIPELEKELEKAISEWKPAIGVPNGGPF